MALRSRAISTWGAESCRGPIAARPAETYRHGPVTIPLLIALVVALLCPALVVRHVPREQTVAPAITRGSTAVRHPVVLAHGLFGFDVLERQGERREYFRGISDRLALQGGTVHRCKVAPVASIATRAAMLADFVQRLPHPKVNVIAHSMGGLDARYAIAKLGLHSRVASLTTIGTPHFGTPLADVGVVVGKGLRVHRLLERLGLEPDAFDDLTTRGAASFNDAVEDVPGVFYASVVGALARAHRASPLLLPTWALLRSSAGPNDGIVPASSQRWGHVLAEIDADHFAQVDGSRSFDAPAFYEALVAELRSRGL